MNGFAYRAAKATDRQIIEALTHSLKEAGFSISETTYQAFGVNLSSNQVPAVLETNTTALSRVDFALANGATIVVTRGSRDNQSEFADTITVSPGGNDVANFAKMIAAAKQSLPPLDQFSFAETLTEREKLYYERRESELNRFLDAQMDFVRKFQSFALEEKERFEQRELESDRRVKERLDTLDERERGLASDHLEKMRTIAEREAQLDSRDATHVRRELLKQQREGLAETVASFNLSRATWSKRFPVHAAFLILLLFLLSIALLPEKWSLSQMPGVPASMDHSDAPENQLYSHSIFVFQLVRRTLAGIGFLVTAAFYLRWTNQWFRDHANEEIRARRLDIDTMRASWLVETAISWMEEKPDAQIPELLLDRLSHNLFTASSETPDGPMSGTDALASLLGNASNMKVRLPGADIELDRKALKRVKAEDGEQIHGH